MDDLKQEKLEDMKLNITLTKKLKIHKRSDFKEHIKNFNAKPNLKHKKS